MSVIHKLKEQCISKNLTISVAESLTGGRLASVLSSISGSSEYFEGGICAYNLKQKVSLLGVNEIHAKEVDCVSKIVALQMCEGVKSKFKSSIALSTTGYIEKHQNNLKESAFCFAHILIGDQSFEVEIESTELTRELKQLDLSKQLISRLSELL